MIEEYGMNYYSETTNNFDDWKYNLGSDPVIRFISRCKPKTETETDEEYEGKINYLVRMFYSVKGTTLVLEYLRYYLSGKLFTGITYEYSPEVLKITMEGLNSSIDPELFFKEQKEFLDALIYQGTKEEEISGNLKLTIEEKFANHSSANILVYKNITINNYEIRD